MCFVYHPHIALLLDDDLIWSISFCFYWFLIRRLIASLEHAFAFYNYMIFVGNF